MVVLEAHEGTGGGVDPEVETAASADEGDLSHLGTVFIGVVPGDVFADEEVAVVPEALRTDGAAHGRSVDREQLGSFETLEAHVHLFVGDPEVFAEEGKLIQIDVDDVIAPPLR